MTPTSGKQADAEKETASAFDRRRRGGKGGCLVAFSDEANKMPTHLMGTGDAEKNVTPG